jgi:hypothetical protein
LADRGVQRSAAANDLFLSIGAISLASDVSNFAQTPDGHRYAIAKRSVFISTVTCSRLGISLRRTNGSHHTADVRGRTIPAPGSVGIAHPREQKEVWQPAARTAPLAKFAITMRDRGKEQTSDIELPSRAIELLACEAMSRDLDIARLIGQILVAAINKDMIQNILRDEVLPSST